MCFRIVLRFPSRDASEAGTNTDDKYTGDKSVQTPPYLDTRFSFESLCRDFDKLLKDQFSNADFQLRCGDRTSKAHKSVLSARSGVFSLLLASNMVESLNGLVEIQGMEWDTFQKFLRYLYTGALPELTVDTAKQLYCSGEMYTVHDLKKQCSDFLMDNLTHQNMCDFLILADRHSDPDFKESVISYILKEKIPLKEDDDRWSNLCISHPELAREVINRSQIPAEKNASEELLTHD